MARMRPIGTTLDDGYRDDLNFNFELLEALIGESNDLTDTLRKEMLNQINNLQRQIDLLTGENIDELLARLDDSIQQALTAAQEARTAKTATEEATALAQTAISLANASAALADEKANYANEKAVLAQGAADNANQESANLGQMKVDVVQATQDANTSADNAEGKATLANDAADRANQAADNAETATLRANTVAEAIEGWGTATPWNSTTEYVKNNVVTDNGSTWQALRTSISVTPVEGLDWTCLARKGLDGEGAVSSVNNRFPGIDGNVEVKWGDIPDKPLTFTPSTHMHEISEVTGLQGGLDSKADETDLIDLEQTVNEHLDEITKNKVYISALNNLNFNPQQLLYFYRAILKGYCKVAVWGDSISEGIGVQSARDTYYAKICRHFQELFPTINFTFENFSIESTGISTTMDDSFVASKVKPQPANTFWRDWAVEGKSWKQHVIDFQPDLVFFAFGMNDMGMGYSSSESFYTRMDLVKDMFTNSFDSDLVIVNNMLPTLKMPEVYNINFANGIAKAAREWCKDNNIALIDANRLSNILMTGKDVETTMKGDSLIFRDVYISVDTTLMETDITNANVILYRNIDDTCFFQVNILSNDGVNSIVQLRYNENSTNILLDDYIFPNTLENTIKIEIECIGANHKIYVDGILGVNIRTSKGLYEGGTLFANWGTGTFTNTYIEKLVPYYTYNIFEESELLGDNVNHPISLGHYLMYYNAFSAFFKNVVNIKKVPASIKLSNWQLASSDYTPPPNKKLYYQIIDMIYDQNNGVTLWYNNKIKTTQKTNATHLITDNEFAMWDWNSNQKIVFIAILEADTPTEGALNYYVI